MSSFRAVACLVCAFGPFAFANTDSGSPVTKIVGLIEELKAKIEADGKAEQNMYNRYACWCETTSARKAANIHQAMADIKSLGTKVLELKSKVTGLNNDIHHLTQQITENQAAQDEATAIRTKDNTRFLAEKTEMETTLSALERGINVLSGAGTKTALLQTEQMSELSSIADGVHKITSKMPNIDKLLTPKQLKLIAQFARDPSEFYDQKAEKAASYNPASATIQGILKDMYDTFSMNLEKSTETDAIAFKNFESLMGVKGREMALHLSERAKRESEKAAAEELQAETAKSYDDTSKMMKEDTIFFDDTKAACTSKSAEWSERVRARTEELAGINKALEILTGDDARALFNKAIKPGMEMGFIQESSTVQSPRNRVYESLKKHAVRAKSLRLMAIAASLKAGGHFDAVTGEIDKMMEVIKQEERDDIRQKDWCKEEMHKNEQEAARYEYKVEKKDQLIGRMRVQLDELETTLQNTIQEIIDTKKDVRQMEDQRKADHAVYQEKKADDEGAVKVMGAAIDALGSFYKNNKAALVQQPTFAKSEDQAPDAGFSSKGKSGGESKGILSIMTMLKEDLEDEITNAVKMEMEDQFYFERGINAAHNLLKELHEKKTNLNSAIADLNTEIDNRWSEREDLQGLLNEEKEYMASIKPDCDYLIETFEDRRNKRDVETQSLIDAKGMLEGQDAAGGEGEVTEAPADEAPAEAAPAEAAPAFLQTSPRMAFSRGTFLK